MQCNALGPSACLASRLCCVIVPVSMTAQAQTAAEGQVGTVVVAVPPLLSLHPASSSGDL